LTNVSTSARSELAALNEELRDAAAVRDEAQAVFEPLVGPAQRLLTLIAQHRVGLKTLADESDDAAYTQKMLELRDVERQIDALQPQIDMLAYRTAEEALREANSRVAGWGSGGKNSSSWPGERR